MFDVTKEGLLLIEVRKDLNVDDVRAKTAAEFKVASDLKPMAQSPLNQ